MCACMCVNVRLVFLKIIILIQLWIYLSTEMQMCPTQQPVGHQECLLISVTYIPVMTRQTVDVMLSNPITN